MAFTAKIESLERKLSETQEKLNNICNWIQKNFGEDPTVVDPISKAVEGNVEVHTPDSSLCVPVQVQPKPNVLQRKRKLEDTILYRHEPKSKCASTLSLTSTSPQVLRPRVKVYASKSTVPNTSAELGPKVPKGGPETTTALLGDRIGKRSTKVTVPNKICDGPASTPTLPRKVLEKTVSGSTLTSTEANNKGPSPGSTIITMGNIQMTIGKGILPASGPSTLQKRSKVHKTNVDSRGPVITAVSSMAPDIRDNTETDPLGPDMFIPEIVMKEESPKKPEPNVVTLDSDEEKSKSGGQSREDGPSDERIYLVDLQSLIEPTENLEPESNQNVSVSPSCLPPVSKPNPVVTYRSGPKRRCQPGAIQSTSSTSTPAVRHKPGPKSCTQRGAKGLLKVTPIVQRSCTSKFLSQSMKVATVHIAQNVQNPNSKDQDSGSGGSGSDSEVIIIEDEDPITLDPDNIPSSQTSSKQNNPTSDYYIHNAIIYKIKRK